jgi:hypothetical protein
MGPTVGMVAGVLVAVATAACDPCAPTEKSGMERKMFESPLHEAVWGGDVERVAQLLDAGADPNGRTAEGSTPLMVAAQFERATLAAALLGAGADVNAQDNRGATALMSAAAERRIQVVTLLLKAGADPNIRTRDGRTALSESKTRKREFHFGSWMFVWGSRVADDDALVRLLRQAGAN